MWGIWAEREMLLARDPSLPSAPPTQPQPSHLLLPTDMAHGGGRSWAGGGSQHRHDPLGQDLTHCEGWGRKPESGALLLLPSHPHDTAWLREGS